MNLRISIWIMVAVLGLAGCQTPDRSNAAGKSGKQPAVYEADLGMRDTPWGVLHVFDRFRAISREVPRYPTEARRSGRTGTVVVLILVGEDGAVADVRVLRSSGHSDLDQSAMEAIRKWKYRPRAEPGSWVNTQPLTFSLEG